MTLPTRDAEMHHQLLLNLYRILTILAVLFIVYLTLFPFKVVLSAARINAGWLNASLPPLMGMDYVMPGRADAVANVLFFMPFGMFLFAFIDFRMRSLSVSHKLVLVLISGCLLSVAVEIIQLSIEDRFTSINDVAANTLGSLAGALVGYKFVREIERISRKMILFFQAHPFIILGCSLLVLQSFIALSPFNFKVDARHVGHKVMLWLASSTPSFVLEANLISKQNAETFLLALLLASSLVYALRWHCPKDRKTWRFAFLVALSCYPVINFLQLFLRSKSTDAIFLYTGTAGMIVGLATMSMLSLFSNRRKFPVDEFWLRHRIMWLLYGALFLLHFFFPFKYNLSHNISPMIDDVVWIPFNVSEVNISTSYVLANIKSFFLALPLGFFISSRMQSAGWLQRAIRSGVILLVVGFLIELLQLQMPAQNTDTTDLVSFVQGGLLGSLLENWWNVKITGKRFCGAVEKRHLKERSV